LAATSSIPAFFDALKALLDARAGIIGPPPVTVATADLGTDTPKLAIVLFGTPTANREAVGLRGPQGISYDHNVVVAGAIWTVKPGQGDTVVPPATASPIKQARDGAYALLAELEQTLKANPTVSGTCQFAAVTSDPLEQVATDEGRLAWIGFQITYRARLV
jgi:hypothetical protein